jgi:uncharacterized protein YjiK
LPPIKITKILNENKISSEHLKTMKTMKTIPFSIKRTVAKHFFLWLGVLAIVVSMAEPLLAQSAATAFYNATPNYKSKSLDISGKDLSGITWCPKTQTYFTIQNRGVEKDAKPDGIVTHAPPSIFEITQTGEILRQIPLAPAKLVQELVGGLPGPLAEVKFHDLEAICYLGCESVSGSQFVNLNFALAEEQRREVVFISLGLETFPPRVEKSWNYVGAATNRGLKIKTVKLLPPSAGPLRQAILAQDNFGLEALAFDAQKGILYGAIEGEAGAHPRIVFTIDQSTGECVELIAAVPLDDISDMAFDSASNELFILSDVERRFVVYVDDGLGNFGIKYDSYKFDLNAGGLPFPDTRAVKPVEWSP